MFKWLFNKREKTVKEDHPSMPNNSIINIYITCNSDGDFALEIDIDNFSYQSVKRIAELMYAIETNKLAPAFLEVYKNMAEENEEQHHGIIALIGEWNKLKQQDKKRPIIDPFNVFNLTNK